MSCNLVYRTAHQFCVSSAVRNRKVSLERLSFILYKKLFLTRDEGAIFLTQSARAICFQRKATSVHRNHYRFVVRRGWRRARCNFTNRWWFVIYDDGSANRGGPNISRNSDCVMSGVPHARTHESLCSMLLRDAPCTTHRHGISRSSIYLYLRNGDRGARRKSDVCVLLLKAGSPPFCFEIIETVFFLLYKTINPQFALQYTKSTSWQHVMSET